MLHGSVRWELEPEERATWVDLLLLAGECSKGGLICDNDKKPLPIQYIASHFNVSLKLLERTLMKCEAQNRISREDGILKVNNWNTYQSEYDRQKPYRQKMNESEKVGMTRSLINQHPKVAIDVLTKDFGHRVVTKQGEILE